MKTKKFIIAMILAIVTALVCPVLVACNSSSDDTAVYKYESLTCDMSGQYSVMQSQMESMYKSLYGDSLAYFKDGIFYWETSSGQVNKTAYTKKGDRYLLSDTGMEVPSESAQMTVRVESYVTYDQSSLQIVCTQYVNDSVYMVLTVNYTVQQAEEGEV